MSFLSSILPIVGTVAGSFLGPAGAAIGGSLGGALGGALSSNDAANAQQQGAQNAIDTQWKMFQQQQANLSPYMKGGEQGYAQLLQLLGLGGGSFNPNAMLVKPFGMSDYQADPGYQFRLKEGENAIINKRAALGGISSGGTLKDLTDYSQGMASQEYQNAYNRYRANQNDIYGRISGIANTGVNAAGTQAGLGANVANNVSSLQAAQGAYGAAGILGGQQAGQNLSNNWLLASYLQNQGSNPMTSAVGNGLNITYLGNPSTYDYSNVLNS